MAPRVARDHAATYMLIDDAIALPQLASTQDSIAIQGSPPLRAKGNPQPDLRPD